MHGKTIYGLLACTTLSLSISSALAAHWGYGEENGPEHWASMDPAFAACQTERFQSPINIAAAETQPSSHKFTLEYTAATQDIVNNGHTVQISAAEGSTLSNADGPQLKLRQFHFHTPSENQVNGQAYPLEAHFVHSDDSGQTMVMGVFFSEGEANPVLEKIIKALPKEVNKPQALTDLDLNGLLPEKKAFYAFTGSLTTPPCSGSVRWAVLQNPLSASKAQIDALHAVMQNNARPVQPLNGRTVGAAEN